VAETTLAGLGAVHEDAAREMAAGVRRLAGATYGLATSGIAGPAGGSAEKTRRYGMHRSVHARPGVRIPIPLCLWPALDE